MRKYRWILIICLPLITFVGVMPRPISGFHYVHYWRARFAGSVVVGGNMSYPIDPFWRYYGNQSWQTSEQLWFEMYLNNLSIHPLHVDQDDDGNPQLVLNLTSNLSPSDILTWNEEWLFTVSDLRPNLPHIIIEQSGIIDEIPDLIGAEAYHSYTRGTTLWKTWNNSLIELAVSLQNSLPTEQRTNVLALIFQAVSWIQANISIPTGITEPQYPEETINSTWGDCDDLSNLLISLLRIYGIPSYLMTGHWYQEGASTSGFIWGSVPQDAYRFVDWRNVVGHGWAMVYVPPWGWLPFDIAANPQATDPNQAYYESLYAKGIPMETFGVLLPQITLKHAVLKEMHFFNINCERSILKSGLP